MNYVRLTEKLVVKPDMLKIGNGVQNYPGYVVGQYAVGKDNREFIRDPKYFTNLADVLEYAVNETIRAGIFDGKYQTLKELADDHKSLYREFREALGVSDGSEVTS